MKPEPTEQDYEKLKKLLALKQHEQPPPGYFNRLPGQIIARIEKAKAEKQLPWWERWLKQPLSRPALSGMYATMALALIVGAAVVGQMVQANKQATVLPSNPDPVISPLPTKGGSQPAAAPMLAADTNGTSAPPAFLVQPGTLIRTQENQVLPAGFKQQ